MCLVSSTNEFMSGQLGAIVAAMSVGIVVCVVGDMFGPIMCFALAGYIASGPDCTVVCF